MKYDYKCEKCNAVKEIYIPTYDIMEGQKKIINNEKLQERIDEERFCECGGKLKRSYKIIHNDDILVFTGRDGVRKQRFA